MTDTIISDKPVDNTNLENSPVDSPVDSTVENSAVENKPAEKKVTFTELGLPEEIIKAVTDIGFEHATPIQIRSIPTLLEGRDLLGLAQTGSGKTASFMLPLLSRFQPKETGVQILVLSPTRELAIQVAKATDDFCKYLPNIKPLAIYGGQPYGGQIAAIRRGANVIIATPGRLVDHLDKGTVRLDNLKAIVLDEADEMLSMGFADDLTRILEEVPETVQTALFSATMPKTIEGLTKKYLKDPAVVKIDNTVKKNQPKIDQYYWLVQQYSRNQALLRFLEVEQYDASIIFCKTKQGCNEVTEFLIKNSYAAASLHGDMSQEVRESTLNGLRNESIRILVATDVAARGLDIDRINLVVNYDLPTDIENYVHRVGRTGRAGREGRAISFVGEKERLALYNIEKIVHKELKEIQVPSNAELEVHRRSEFKRKLEIKLDDHSLEKYSHLVETLIPPEYSTSQVIAALVNLATQNCRLVLPKEREHRGLKFTYDRERYARGARNGRGSNDRRDGRNNRFGDGRDFQAYFLSVGRNQGLDVQSLIRLISSIEKNVKIGQISLKEDFSIVDLPKNFSQKSLETLANKEVGGKKIAARIFEKRGGKDGDRRGREGGFRNNFRDRDGNREGSRRDFNGERRGGRGERNFERNSERNYERNNDRKERGEFRRDRGERRERKSFKK